MNRADIIKLVSYQLQEEIEKARVSMLQLADKCRLAFMNAAADWAMRKNKAQVLYMVNHTGGNPSRIKAVVHYDLTDDELVNPRDHFTVTFRDGEQWDQTFEFTVQMPIEDELDTLRKNWMTFHIAYITARNAGTRMTCVKPEAWKKVVESVLDNTEAGQSVKDASPPSSAPR